MPDADIVSLAAGLFLIAYGLGVIGWPYDWTAGIRLFARMSLRTRRLVGVATIAVGLFLAAASLVSTAF